MTVAFMDGYRAGLDGGDPDRLAQRLDTVEPSDRGFAYEGACMGLTIRDGLSPWRHDRVRRFVAGPGAPHRYMAHVGIGWGMARLPRRRWGVVLPHDRLLGWLALDGYGFHQAFFRTAEYVGRQRVDSALPWPWYPSYAPRVVDQGIGRALWFVAGADVRRVAATVTAFPPPRRPDLWSGVGLAAAYAGAASAGELAALRDTAGAFAPQLAQGAAFAAKARVRAATVNSYAEMAMPILCDRSLDEAAAITDEALADLPADGAVPAYESWRRRIQHRVARLEV